MARTDLDYDHISAVCDRLAQTRTAVGLNITPTRRGYAIDARSAAGARRVQQAFARLGYRANLPERYGRNDQVTLTGWNRPALQARITLLHQALDRLDGSRDRTAADAIDHGLRSRGELHDTLRAAVEQTTGIITNPLTIGTGDHDCARLLETAHRLERDVTAQIRRHVDAAETAVHLYRQYRPGMPDAQARDLAITTASALAPPPGWDNAPGLPDPTKQHNAPAPDANAPAAGEARTAAPEDHLDRPARTTAIETPGEHPAAVAAHDQPSTTPTGTAPRGTAPTGGVTTGGAQLENVSYDTPPAQSVTPPQPSPARRPATG